MQYTPNINLKKPELNDYVNVEDLNDNASIIDEEIKSIQDEALVLNDKIDNQSAGLNDKITNHIDDFSSHTRYGLASGVNAKTATLSPAPTAYVDGMGIAFKNLTANTGAATINVNGLGAKPIVRPDGTPLSNGTLIKDSVYTVRYNGVAFILQGEGGEPLIDPNYLKAGDEVMFAKIPGAYPLPNEETKHVASINSRANGIVTLHTILSNQHVSGKMTLQVKKNNLILWDENVRTTTSGGGNVFTKEIELEKNDVIDVFFSGTWGLSGGPRMIEFSIRAALIKDPFDVSILG